MSSFLSKWSTKKERGIFTVVKEGSVDELEMLLSKGKVGVNDRDEDEWTPLCWSAFNGNFPMTKLLVKHGALVNVTDKQGRTPLYLSCGWGSGDSGVEVTNFLISNGADVDKPTTDGWTALYFCAFRGKPQAVKLLINSQADVLKADKMNRTALEIAKSRKHKDIVSMLENHGGQLLCNAANSSNISLCRRILAGHLADINSQTKNGWTSLHLAVGNNNLELASFLLKENANPNLCTSDGLSTKDIAIKTNNRKIIALFEESSADTELKNQKSEQSLKSLRLRKITKDLQTEISKQIDNILNNSQLPEYSKPEAGELNYNSRYIQMKDIFDEFILDKDKVSNLSEVKSDNTLQILLKEDDNTKSEESDTYSDDLLDMVIAEAEQVVKKQ